MKPGWGAGSCLADIALGVPTDTIRQRWVSGEYGNADERPRGDFVKAWLQMDGRQVNGTKD